MILHFKGVNKMLFLGLKVHYDDLGFLSLSLSLSLYIYIYIYGKVKEVLFDVGFDGLGFNPRV